MRESGPRDRERLGGGGTVEAQDAPLSVSELSFRLRRAVENATREIEVHGEVVGLRDVASGHLYFTLKDERVDAVIDCVMYRTAPARSRSRIANGASVVLRGEASIYAPRGRLQFVAEEARPLGRGALLEALVALKKKLADEGLFASERKRPLPKHPRVIGVVTSIDGAVLHDIVKVAWRRGRVRFVVARAPVQGKEAPVRLQRALAMLARHPEVEVIIVARGGGSTDELTTFWDEALVRAVAECRVPVVSAVGHETDLTLVDFAADARASTPSQAAELVVFDDATKLEELGHLVSRMKRATARRVDRARLRLDDLSDSMESAMAGRLDAARTTLVGLEGRLVRRHPKAVLVSRRAEVAMSSERMRAAMINRLARERATLASTNERARVRLRARMEAEKARVERLSLHLATLSPLGVLRRGYSIVSRADGRIVRRATDLSRGEVLGVRFSEGQATVVVDGTSDSNQENSEET